MHKPHKPQEWGTGMMTYLITDPIGDTEMGGIITGIGEDPTRMTVKAAEDDQKIVSHRIQRTTQIHCQDHLSRSTSYVALESQNMIQSRFLTNIVVNTH